MKKLLVIAALLLILTGRGNAGADISRMEPVGLVHISSNGGQITVQTDTGASGSGVTLTAAVEDLHESSPAVVFLDTAEFLLVDGQQALNREVYELFRPACRVCAVQGEADLQQAYDYLRIHSPRLRLLDIRAGAADLQSLRITDGSGYLDG